MRQLSYEIVEWPAKGEFRISRNTLTHFSVVQVKIRQNGYQGRAECRPYDRYNETVDTVIAQIEDCRGKIEAGLSNEELLTAMPAGAARNALDCALWDLNCKMKHKRIWEVLEIPPPNNRRTAFTISLDSPEKMAAAAKNAKEYSLLKIKIGSKNGVEACNAILSARADAKLIIDANEALIRSQLDQICQLPQKENIALIEQPFPSGDDRSGLFGTPVGPVICADESLHTSKNLENIWDAGFRAVNVKLDKTGGLTEALISMRKAREMGFVIMAGCMVGSSLAMAPMAVLEGFADYIDLDGPLLLSDDVKNALQYDGERMFQPTSALWG